MDVALPFIPARPKAAIRWKGGPAGILAEGDQLARKLGGHLKHQNAGWSGTLLYAYQNARR